MSAPFDPSKPVQTRDGRKARIICTDRKGAPDYQPIIALTLREDGKSEYIISVDYNGQYSESPGNNDLVNVPEKVGRWINFYRSGTARGHASREAADLCAGTDRVACVYREAEEGEGL